MLGTNREVFATNLSELGCTDLYPHRVEIRSAPPVRQRFYRQSPAIKAEASKHIEETRKYDIIEPSQSEWASPICLVLKKSAKSASSTPNTPQYRFCVDFRLLNSLTTKKVHPIVQMDDIVDMLGEAKAKIYTTVDMFNGYHQIKLDLETKHKTALTCHEGVLEFNRLPFGLSNSPHTFQLVMSEALRGLANYYRKDVKGFSKIASPLHRLLVKGAKFIWDNDCQNAIDEIKKLLISALILAFPDFSKDFILYTDASQIAIGYKGAANCNADALRRRPYDTEIVTITTSTVESSTQTETTSIELDPYASICEITTSPKEKVVNDQRTDENFKDIIKHIIDKVLPDKTRQARKTVIESQVFIIDDDVLFHLCYPKGKGHRADRIVKRLAVPLTLRNTSVCTESTQYTPCFLLFGRECRTPMDTILTEPSKVGPAAKQYIDKIHEHLVLARAITRENAREAQKKPTNNVDVPTDDEMSDDEDNEEENAQDAEETVQTDTQPDSNEPVRNDTQVQRHTNDDRKNEDSDLYLVKRIVKAKRIKKCIIT
ncbi:unnamed protein product [Mytilus coruscus]|uniref:Reverse transcriptase/retrotransposon-derived protein RNase H-like domain-containing protein n=1 Tax=Mytilus coruscus TaxID=42192 RepID=A0A6J8BBA5_MYTCO|nr:unnamed protein product [Mytilus coruscus]